MSQRSGSLVQTEFIILGANADSIIEPHDHVMHTVVSSPAVRVAGHGRTVYPGWWQDGCTRIVTMALYYPAQARQA